MFLNSYPTYTLGNFRLPSRLPIQISQVTHFNPHQFYEIINIIPFKKEQD